MARKPARKTAARKPRQTRKRRSTKASPINRMLAVLPFEASEIRRFFTLMFCLGLAALAWIIAAQFEVQQRLFDRYAAVTAQAGFQVERVEIRGIDRVDELAVYEIALAEQDRAMPHLDVDALREQLLEFGWIADARVSRQLPDTLVVDIVEREAFAVWDKGTSMVLIDAEGNELETLAPDATPSLVVMSGPDVRERLDNYAFLIDQAPALAPLVRQAEWIGNRRWNLTFQGGEVLALPEGGSESGTALQTFARMDGLNRILGSGVSYIDLRDPTRAYMRLPQDDGAAPAESN